MFRQPSGAQSSSSVTELTNDLLPPHGPRVEGLDLYGAQRVELGRAVRNVTVSPNRRGPVSPLAANRTELKHSLFVFADEDAAPLDELLDCLVEGVFKRRQQMRLTEHVPSVRAPRQAQHR